MKNNPFNRKSNPLIWRHVLCATGKRHPWITRTPLERPRSTLSACVHVMRSAREWKRGKCKEILISKKGLSMHDYKIN